MVLYLHLQEAGAGGVESMTEVSLADSGFRLPAACVAAGRFDGVHAGHRAALALMAEQARAAGLPAVVLRLGRGREHAPENKVLSTDAETAYLVNATAGPAYYLFAPDETAMFSEALVQNILVEKLGTKVFAAGGEYGALPLLEACSAKYGYRLAVCPQVQMDGAPVTRARVAALLAAGDVEAANRLLGHPYLIMGPVVRGQGRGRAVGIPTANIGYAEEKLLPGEGVYATFAEVGGKRLFGLVNIGRRPSVDDDQHFTVENYIPDFAGNLYGQTLRLEVLFRIRGMLKLDGIEGVKAQVDRDLSAARMRLGEFGG